MTNIVTILPKIYFPARWLVRAVIQNRDTRFSTEVESEVKSRQSRLICDAWTLCKGFGGSRDMLPRKKIRNLRSSNCWKCIEVVNFTITVLFLYHLKYFTIPSGGPFWLFGGGGGSACAPRAPPPPCLRA